MRRGHPGAFPLWFLVLLGMLLPTPNSLGLTGSVVRDTDIELNPTYTLTQKDGTVVTYEGGEGRVSVQSITNARGDRLSFKEYNATESTIIRDGTGRTLTLNRDDEGHITDVGFPDPDNPGTEVKVHYVYDRGRLVRVVRPGLYTTAYRYDVQDRLLSVIDANGNAVLTNEYSPENGRLVEQSDLRNSVQRGYTDGASQADVTNTDTGYKATLTYDSVGAVIESQDSLADPRITSAQYPAWEPGGGAPDELHASTATARALADSPAGFPTPAGNPMVR